MRKLLDDLFPVYRTLCGPGAKETLERIQQEIPLEIKEYPSGTEVMGWTIPKEFVVNEAWVKDKYGKKIIDFDAHPYHLWSYSQPFSGEVSRDELLEHLTSQHRCVPLRQTYYKDDWGFSCTDDLRECIEDEKGFWGPFEAHIDVEHRDGHLRIGEAYHEGETEQEVLINSYVCHPLGANDNLSGVVCAVNLFKRLAQTKTRYSYRLCLWPETIGPIAWIAANDTSIVVGGMTLGICGDDYPLVFDESVNGGPMDNALAHAMSPPMCREYSGFMGPTDSRHFNGMGLNIPMVTLTRGGPAEFPEYHTSLDTPDIINWENMDETVEVAFNAIQVLERNQVYRPRYVTTPCLQKHGIFPYQHGTGTGGNERTNAARAYFELMYLVDGKRDLLSIADSQGLSIFDFDEPVEKFLEAGLIEPA